MIDKILAILTGEGFSIEETIMSGTQEEFWHSTIIDATGVPFSGGFGKEKMAARKIAVSEFLERRKFFEISDQYHETKKDLWGLSIIPTACGFAAGFNRDNTVLRSIHEAIERWVMSKWIDDHFIIPEVPQSGSADLDQVSLFLIGQFDKVMFFRKDILVPFGDKVFRVDVAQTMGISGEGIFPGSSAQYTGGNIWQHALIESYRHLLAVRNNPDRGEVFPENKVRYFAKNADKALAQISRAKQSEWPVPSAVFHRVEAFDGGDYFVARTIFDGWLPWTLGPIDRFLY